MLAGYVFAGGFDRLRFLCRSSLQRARSRPIAIDDRMVDGSTITATPPRTAIWSKTSAVRAKSSSIAGVRITESDYPTHFGR
jgi:hypothetical protein